MSKFLYSESKIAQKIGVSRYDMRNLRERFLTQGVDWENLGGRKGGVAYSDQGMKSLASHLPLAGLDLREVEILSGIGERTDRTDHTPSRSESVPNGSLLGGVQPEPKPSAQTFKVFRIPPNPRIVLARDGEGKMQTVWVGRNGTFVVGDEIEVAPHEEQVNVWRFTGKIPRDKRRQRLRP